MSENFEILLNYIKDLSIETPDAETIVYVKDNISKYQMNIDINSQPIKNKMIEVNTKLTFSDNTDSKKKSLFEIIYSSVVKIKKENIEKKEIEKIVLCDVPQIIYPKLEKIFLNLLSDAGYPGVNFQKKIDFEKLYSQRAN
tara:strand:- start:928 stop:1350 length:423 start_codon:yes stop_codon:yes gene_type:complete